MMCSSTKLRLSFFALLIASQSLTVNAQTDPATTRSVATTSCGGGISATFNDGPEDFVGSNGIVYNTNGFFNIPAVQSNVTNYTLTSDAYLVANTTSIRAGIDFSGDGTNDFTSYRLNIIDASTGAVLATCNVDIELPDEITSGSVCQTITNPNLAGKNIRFQVVLSTDSDASGSFILDNSRTNLPLGAVTPVEFTDFDATKVSNGVLLTWKVATEINVKNYEVEKSLDGRTYSKIGVVNATNNSTYTFTDAQASTGTVYYRIKNVDNDGKFKYSTVVSYANGKSTVQTKAFPTVTKGMVTLQHARISSNAAITISNMEGRTIRSIVPARGTTTTPIDLSGYPTGTYVIRFQPEGGSTETFRIVKQ